MTGAALEGLSPVDDQPATDRQVGEDSTSSAPERRWVWALVCLAVVTVPFLAVEYVPSTDLPQHLGQLRLFTEALNDPDDLLTIQWWTPYGMVYGLLALPWVLLPPVLAGKVGLWLIVALQIGAVHWIARRWRRPVAGALLASAFVFHNQLYWGFLNFLFAFVVFVGWYALTRRAEEVEMKSGWRTAFFFFLAAGALYLSHALWFACGLLWVAIESLMSRRSVRNIAWRVAGVAPMVAIALYWYAFLRRSLLSSAPEWLVGPLGRLHPIQFTLASLGGLRHTVELLVMGCAALWILAALVSRRRERYFGCDRYLLALAGLFLSLYLFVPNKFSTTMQFSTRWTPFFLLTLLLAVGSPGLRRSLRRTVALAILGTFMTVTAAFWLGFESRELTGLDASLAAIEGDSRVIGLSYVEKSRFLRGQPFVQTYSWAYAVHGGMLNFSFGDFPLSLVVYNDPDRFKWTRGLEWVPKAIRRSDFDSFDYALIGGDQRAHSTMLGVGSLTPIVTEGVWRLYRVEPSPESWSPELPSSEPSDS